MVLVAARNSRIVGDTNLSDTEQFSSIFPFGLEVPAASETSHVTFVCIVRFELNNDARYAVTGLD